jgi:hypothetical protein
MTNLLQFSELLVQLLILILQRSDGLLNLGRMQLRIHKNKQTYAQRTMDTRLTISALINDMTE